MILYTEANHRNEFIADSLTNTELFIIQIGKLEDKIYILYIQIRTCVQLCCSNSYTTKYRSEKSANKNNISHLLSI